MASLEEVEGTIQEFCAWMDGLDAGLTSRLPNHATIEANCTDLGRKWHAIWVDGSVTVHEGPARGRAIRVEMTSDDFVALGSGRLSPQAAYREHRLSVRASFRDIMRLRTAF